jgi:hypothetical protein
MRTSRGFIRTSLLLAGLSLAVCSSAAASGTPAQVTVRVLGQAPGFTTLLPLTHVTTTAAPLVKDGGSCAGTSAAGALDLATGSAWEGHWNTGFGDYEVLSIEGREYPFDASSNRNYYWSFWLDGVESPTGICGTQLSAGDELLFFPSCFGSECPATPNVLAVQAQEAAEVGSPVTFTVLSHPGTGGAATPASGATVSSPGASSQQTDSSGHATLTFAHAGTYTIHVAGSGTGPESVPGEASVCVHNGNDGTCGTTAPQGSPTSTTSTTTTQSRVLSGGAPYRGPFALVARTDGPLDSHVYSRRDAPRILAGSVLSHSPVTSIALRLRRTNRGRRCAAYDGLRERFVAARCGTGSFFAVSTSDAYSYLLPAPLAPGRYVLDIRAGDAVGNQTVAARGTSRIVFYVR